MINFLIGAPGGGKSYEAVAYHLLPALEQGRKVITNLPLNLEHFALINPDYLKLIDVRTVTKAVRETIDWKKSEMLFRRFGISSKQKHFIDVPFAHIEDYQNDWRHPETGTGVLYIIDECHLCLPRFGTSMDVEHWYSLHRHEFADVLLMTQSYGKINQSIRDLVQVTYKVRKNVAFGSSTTYVRKVLDGVRGEVLNTTIRKYEKHIFPFYKSHTKSSSVGVEYGAADIIPFWKRPIVMGSVFFCILPIVLLFVLDLKNPMKPDTFKPKPKPLVFVPVKNAAPTVPNAAPIPAPIPSVQNAVPIPAPIPPVQNAAPIPPVDVDPYSENGIHLVGHLFAKLDSEGKIKTLWILSLSQNGQLLRNLYSYDFEKIGYKFEPLNDCGAWLTFGTKKRFIKCDSPTVGISLSKR